MEQDALYTKDHKILVNDVLEVVATRETRLWLTQVHNVAHSFYCHQYFNREQWDNAYAEIIRLTLTRNI